jgi:hypothetical protein
MVQEVGPIWLATSRTASAPPYAGLRLDRALGRRSDDAWVGGAIGDPRPAGSHAKSCASMPAPWGGSAVPTRSTG